MKVVLHATYDPESERLAPVECRIHVTFTRGAAEVWTRDNGDPGQPADPDEIDVDQVEIVSLVDSQPVWKRWAATEGSPDLDSWARRYVEENVALVYETVHARETAVAEERAEREKEVWTSDRSWIIH